MRITNLFRCFIVSLLFLASVSSAQEVPRFYGKEMVVTATRLPVFADKLSHVPANVTVITRKDIDESGATNLPELLGQYEGMIVTDRLGFGLDAQVDMRGFGGEAKNSLVLLDGVRLSEPYDNSLFWKLFSLEDIERVEIIRGGFSSIYGEGALGGVINIVTKKGETSPEVNAEIASGNYGQQKYRIGASGKRGSFRYYVGGTSEKIGGYRENSEHDGTTLLAKLGYLFDETSSLDISVNIHNDNTGIAGGITEETRAVNPRQKAPTTLDTDGYENKLNIVSLDYQKRISDKVKFSSNGFLRSRLINSSYWNTLYRDDTQASGIATQLSIDGTIISSVLGIEYNQSLSNLELSGGKVDKSILGIFMQEDLHLSKNYTLFVGARYDQGNYDITNSFGPSQNTQRSFANLSPKFGLRYNLGDRFSWFVTASQAFKAPEANVLISPAPGLFPSNTEIQATKVSGYEFGVRYATPRGMEIKTNYYVTKASNEILFNIYGGGLFGKNENFDTIRRGLELSLKYPVFDWLSFGSTYTNSEALFASGSFQGKTIPQVPKNKFTAALDFKFGNGLGANINFLRVADQYILNDFNNINPAENYNVVNGCITYRRGKISLFVSGRNLLGEKYSPFTAMNAAGTIKYNPAPERSIVAGVDLNL